MNQLPILIRREFWEHRNVFLVLPAAIVGFVLIMYVLIGFATTTDDMKIHVEAEGDVEFIDDLMEVDNAYEYAVLQLADLPPGERSMGVQAALLSMSGAMFFVAWLVIFIYLLGSLYADRKDRSILFWKSMPVSDGMTVAAKLLTALVCVPLVYLAGAVVLQLVGLLIMTFVAMGAGVSAWEVVWQASAYPWLLVQMLLAIVFLALWHLPLFGWLMTVSAFARSVPFVWALGLPSGLMIAEKIVTNQSRLGAWMGQHTVPSRLVENGRSLMDNMTTHAASIDMVTAIVVGAILIFAAIWLRGNADEI